MTRRGKFITFPKKEAQREGKLNCPSGKKKEASLLPGQRNEAPPFTGRKPEEKEVPLDDSKKLRLRSLKGKGLPIRIRSMSFEKKKRFGIEFSKIESIRSRSKDLDSQVKKKKGGQPLNELEL